MWVEKNGPTWRIRDEVGGKKITIKKGFATKTAAKTVLVQMQSDALRGEALVPRGDEMTLGAWIDLWWPTYKITLKRTAQVSADGILRRYIRPMLGHVRLGELIPIVVQQWVADLLEGRRPDSRRKLAPKTIRNAHGLLHKVLGEACAQRMIRWNPCERTGLPGRVHHEMKFLAGPEADRIVAALPEYWRPLILLILATGLRWGEAVGLRVRDVDVLEGWLRVRKATYELADTAEIIDEEPKTAASRRTVTFTKDIAQMLIPLVANKGDDDRVFTALRGGVVRQRRFYEVWQKARIEAGLEGLRIHDLRHTHAAWLISAKVPLTAVQRRLGHQSIAVTSDLYGHLLPEVHEEILAVVERVMSVIDFRGLIGGIGEDQGRSTVSSGAGLPA